MGPNTPTLRNHGLGQIFHTHEKKKKVDSVGLDEASLELGVSSEGRFRSDRGREGGGVSLHTLRGRRQGVIRKPRGKELELGMEALALRQPLISGHN